MVLQGLNGILADEMGLGKTIQAMVFLAHLAEVMIILSSLSIISFFVLTTITLLVSG